MQAVRTSQQVLLVAKAIHVMLKWQIHCILVPLTTDSTKKSRLEQNWELFWSNDILCMRCLAQMIWCMVGRECAPVALMRVVTCSIALTHSRTCRRKLLLTSRESRETSSLECTLNDQNTPLSMPHNEAQTC